jgi:alginate O-acetyltransferase complex protein AlgI
MIQTPAYWLLLFGSALVFWRLPPAWRLRFLAVVSGAYLASLAPLAIAALLGWTTLFYSMPRWAQQHKFRRMTSILVIAILGYLVAYKYLPEIAAAISGSPALQLVVPLGISYFTVKLIHYAVEMSRGTLPAHGFGDFACWILLFPIFTAGPVERFDHFIKERAPKWESAHALIGLTRIAHGLIKRFVIAEALLHPRLGIDGGLRGLLAGIEHASVLQVWAFFLVSFVYLYLEFSAYSDIAIGSARLFGLRIMENFDWPILATSLGEFWRRWHMSLSGWCRGYVYMPMIGRTRNPYVASYASFTVMGLWHGASLHWLAWGVLHASGMTAYTMWTRAKQRRKWTWFNGRAGDLAGWALTIAFVTLVSAVPAFDTAGTLHDMLRVTCRLLGLPA